MDCTSDKKKLKSDHFGIEIMSENIDYETLQNVKIRPFWD